MSFLLNNDSEYLASRVTNRGRQKIAQGNFNIRYFQVGDSEYDYNFSEFDGILGSPQKVFTPLDKDDIVKYPYKFSSSPITGTTYGIPIQESHVETIKNKMGEAGFVSKYSDTGSTIDCTTSGVTEIDITSLDGTNIINVSDGTLFNNCEYITVAFTQLVGVEGVITGNSNSLVYRILEINGNSITVDRQTPILTGFTGVATVICNSGCDDSWEITDPCAVNTDPLGPWALNIIWSKKPAGMDVPAIIDENLTGYTSNVFVSTKEFLGYNTSSGQTYNTGTTITNSFGDDILVLPEEQHSLGIVHYNLINTEEDPERFFKYEDYIAHDEDESEYFEIYIPFLLYHRTSGDTIGARFFMDSVDYYINSSASDTKRNKIKYRYLIDESGIRVGKVFVNHKIVVFDDQEIVATLDYKSNRKYTLPVPRISQTPLDMKCDVNNTSSTGLMSSDTGETIFVTYRFDYILDKRKNGLHCNHYSKITGTTLNADVSIKFDTDDFTFMRPELSGYTNGYIADKFSILVQKVDTGNQPEPNQWKIIDFTSEIPSHTPGSIIDPENMKGSRFVITNEQYEDADYYDIENYMESDFPDEPSTSPQFGDEQPFPGSVTLTRAMDIQVMRYLINLPTEQFETTQNPSWSTGKPKRVTEIALLDDSKDVLVIGKTPKPIVRTGTQVFVVKIDF